MLNYSTRPKKNKQVWLEARGHWNRKDFKISWIAWTSFWIRFKAFNYSMPKQKQWGCRWKKFYLLIDVKYQFNKIFSFLIKHERKCRKTSFHPRFGSVRSQFGPQFFFLFFLFFEVSFLLDVRHCPKLQSCVISRKVNDTIMRKWRKT